MAFIRKVSEVSALAERHRSNKVNVSVSLAPLTARNLQAASTCKNVGNARPTCGAKQEWLALPPLYTAHIQFYICVYICYR